MHGGTNSIGPLVHLGRQRLVFDQLEKLVLEHHRAFGGGHVAPDLEGALVGLRDMALLHVLQQLLHALGDAFTLGREGLLQRLGVERQEVGGRRRVDPLLHREADARPGLLVALHRIGQLHQRAGVQQVHLGGVGRGRVLQPFLAGEAAVADRHRLGLAIGLQPLERLVPDVGDVLQVVGLDLGQVGRRHAQRAERFPHVGHRRAEGVGLQVEGGQLERGIGHRGLLSILGVRGSCRRWPGPCWIRSVGKQAYPAMT
jgi:hypothetical protein